MREAPVREAPVREAPVREAPVREAPVREAPVGRGQVRSSSAVGAGGVVWDGGGARKSHSVGVLAGNCFALIAHVPRSFQR